ncbi:MAG: DUF1858 domain-containing protein, partial [Pyrinomonadaceae bacterium]
MRITPDMKIKDVLTINEHMLDAFTRISPGFERLRNPALRRAMAGRVSVAQAARIGKIPLTEALYLLNLTSGENEEQLASELQLSDPEDFQYHSENLPARPRELLG